MNNDNRTVYGVIKSRLPEFDKLKKQGYKQSYFIELLKNDGYKVSAGYFRTCLFRARQELDEELKSPPLISTEKPLENANASSQTTEAKTASKFKFNGTGNPEDLV